MFWWYVKIWSLPHNLQQSKCWKQYSKENAREMVVMLSMFIVNIIKNASSVRTSATQDKVIILSFVYVLLNLVINFKCNNFWLECWHKRCAKDANKVSQMENYAQSSISIWITLSAIIIKSDSIKHTMLMICQHTSSNEKCRRRINLFRLVYHALNQSLFVFTLD